MVKTYAIWVIWILLVAVFAPAPLPGAEAAKSAALSMVDSALLNRNQEAAGSFSSPILGWVPDRQQGGIRPILGAAGASRLGERVQVPYRDFWPSARWPYGIAATAGASPALLLLDYQGKTLEEKILTSGTFRVKQAAFNSLETAVALVLEETPEVLLIRGLPADPVTVHLDTRLLPGKLVCLALDEDGSTLLAGTLQGDGGSIYRLTPGGEPQFVLSSRRPAALKFLPRSRNALLLDQESGTLGLIQAAATGGGFVLLADSRQGIVNPSAVEISRDGERAWVLHSGGQAVTAVELNTRKFASMNLSRRAESFASLGGGDGVRISECCGGPVWLLDGSEEMRLVFVPAASREFPAERSLALPRRDAQQPRTNREP